MRTLIKPALIGLALSFGAGAGAASAHPGHDRDRYEDRDDRRDRRDDRGDRRDDRRDDRRYDRRYDRRDDRYHDRRDRRRDFRHAHRHHRGKVAYFPHRPFKAFRGRGFNCRPIEYRGRFRGKPALYSARQCFGPYGRPFIVEGSERLIRVFHRRGYRF
ncbi:MAG: hypothetical protein AAFR11_14135 [Pseudomonadota bacterium]